MAEGQFYVRARGKITGPYDLQTLQKLVRRGMLTKLHEVSEDKQSWVAAGEYEDLFPARQTAAAVARAVPVAAVVAEPEIDLNRPASEPQLVGSSATTFFYQHPGGVVVGPVPMAILKSLADNGTLRPDDLVWQDGAEMTTPAGQLAQLAPIFFGRGRNAASSLEEFASNSASYPGPTVTRKVALGSVELALLKRSNSYTSTYVTIMSIIVGVLTLLALHLPWGSVNDRIIGWWTVLDNKNPSEQSNVVVVAILSVVIISLSSLGLAITGSILRGRPRAFTLLGIGGIGVFNFLICLFTLPSASLVLLGFVVFYLIPTAATTVASISRANICVRSSEHGKTLLGVASGVLGLSAIVVSIVVMPWLIEGAKVASVLVAFVLFFVAILVFLASSVLGFISLKPKFSVGLAVTTKICARTGIGLLVASFMLAIFDVAGWASFFSGVMNRTDLQHNSSSSDMRLVLIMVFLRLLVLLLLYPMSLALASEEAANVIVIDPVLKRSRTH